MIAKLGTLLTPRVLTTDATVRPRTDSPVYAVVYAMREDPELVSRNTFSLN